MYKIYKHTCLKNGKSYIGITRNKLNRRWANGYGYRKKDQKVFWEAIQKYGWDNFEHVILESDIKTLEEAELREQYWIAYFHTYIGDENCNGYNMTLGGRLAGKSYLTKIVKEKEEKWIHTSELNEYIANGWHKAFKNETWNLKHPNYQKEYNKKYRETHREQHNAANRAYRAKKKLKK